MGTQKGANWVFGRDVKGVEASPGVERRVLAYCDELMCVENVFHLRCIQIQQCSVCS